MPADLIQSRNRRPMGRSILENTMTGEITTYRPVSLADLGTEINDSHAQAILHAGQAMNHALRCGDLLIKAKGTVQHGRWLPWLRQNIAFSERTAQGYMRIAQRYSSLQKRDSVADLSVRGVLKEIATPRRHALDDDLAAWIKRSEALKASRPANTTAWSIDDAVACIKIIRECDEIWHRHGLCTGDDDLSELCLVCSTENDKLREPASGRHPPDAA